jgi:hypothetical protein
LVCRLHLLLNRGEHISGACGMRLIECLRHEGV